jgi:hypothetical protein
MFEEIKKIAEAGRCLAELAAAEKKKFDEENHDGGSNDDDFESFAADVEFVQLNAADDAAACAEDIDRFATGKIFGKLFARIFDHELNPNQ